MVHFEMPAKIYIFLKNLKQLLKPIKGDKAMFMTEKVIVVLISAVLLTIPCSVSAQSSPQLSQEFWNITLAAGEEELDVQSEQSDGGYVDYLRRRIKEGIEAPRGVVSTTLPRRTGFITHNYAYIPIRYIRDEKGNRYPLVGDENGYMSATEPIPYSFQFDPEVNIQYHYIAVAFGVTNYLTAAINFQFTKVDSLVNKKYLGGQFEEEEDFWQLAEVLYDRRKVVDYHTDGVEFGDISLIGKFRYYSSDLIGAGGYIEVRLPTSEPLDPAYSPELRTGIGIPSGGRFEPGRWAITLENDIDVFLPEPLDNFIFFTSQIYGIQVGGKFDSPKTTALDLEPIDEKWHGTEVFPQDEDLGPTYEKKAGDQIFFNAGFSTDILPIITPQIKYQFMCFLRSKYKSNLESFDKFMNEQAKTASVHHLTPQLLINLLQFKIPLTISYSYSWPFFVRDFYEFPHHILSTTLYYIF